jgi:hypothetical protein
MKPRHPAAIVVLGVVAVLAVGCGDDSNDAADSRDTVTLGEWVEQFDRACIAAARALSDAAPPMSDAEFAAFNAGAFTILGALKPPDDKTDTAAGLLDDLRSSQEPGLDEDQLAAIDQRVLQAMTDLGISEQCTGGVPG